MKWKIARLSGIDVFIHWSFWILPIWILSASSGRGIAAALGSVGFVFAIFGCVVLHELGHALAARFYGVGTRDITLYPIGGVASLERMPERPIQELVIAVAGPLVNVVIAATLLMGSSLSSAGPWWQSNPLEGGLISGLIWVNVALVIFNMLPAFPMDGGRVLRALLATALPYTRATIIAARIGQLMAIGFGLIGLWSPNFFLLAVFIFLAASAELARARWRDQVYEAELVEDPGRVVQPTFIQDKDGTIWVATMRPRS